MKHFISIILFFFIALPSFAQQQEIIQLDSCKQFDQNNESIFSNVLIRVSQTARWNNKMSITDFFQTYFSKYVQKNAGGRITLSLLITKNGQPCFYRAQHNSNVRPDYKELKVLLDQTKWLPATQNGESVTSLKVLFLDFSGKKVTIQELE